MVGLLNGFSLIVGKVTGFIPYSKDSNHGHLLVDVNGRLYRAVINQTKQQVYKNENYVHPIVNQLIKLPPGKYDKGADLSPSLEIDFTVMNLIPNGPSDMRIIYKNELNKFLADIVSVGLQNNEMYAYIFGECCDNLGQTEHHFIFSPTLCIRNIHMNQRNPPPYDYENGPGQDGCMFFFDKTRTDSKLIAFFSKFNSQNWSDVYCDKVLITEVLAHAPNDKMGEWIKISNLTQSTINLTGWKLTERVTYVFPDDTEIKPNSKLIIAKTTEGFYAMYGFEPDLVWSDLALGNNGDIVDLRDSENKLMDRLIFGKTTDNVSLVRKINSDNKYITNLDIDDWTNGCYLGNPSQL